MGSGLALYQGMASSHAATLRKGIGLYRLRKNAGFVKKAALSG